MFYIEYVNETIEKPYDKFILGTVEFERAIRMYFLNIGELTATQLQTFMGTMFVLGLHDEFMSSTHSSYVVRFSPDE